MLKPNLNWTFYSLFGLLLLPAIWYSLNTPFALIDDYTDWRVVKTFSSLSGCLKWVQNLFFYFGPGRFRPIFEIYNYLTWSIFGANHHLHHLARLLLKFAAGYFSIKTISLFVSNPKNKINLGIFTFLSIYLFYPNCPEARLSPQELEVVLFLSILFFYIGRLLLKKNGNLCEISKTDYIAMLLSFTLLAGSKEPAVVFTSLSLCFIIALTKLTLKGTLKILPFIIVFIFSFAKIYSSFSSGGYGIKPITLDLMSRNIEWYSKEFFLMNTSKVFTLLFLMPFTYFLLKKVKLLKKASMIVRARGFLVHNIKSRLEQILIYDKESTFYIFLTLNFLAFFVFSLAFWEKVIRYFYPLVYIISVLLGLGFAHNFMFYKRGKRFVVIICLFYFIFGNYYNFLYQFAAQYSTRRTESKMLQSVNYLLEEGKTVHNVLRSEFEGKINCYFNEYLPFYHGTKYRIKNIQKDQQHKLSQVNGYYVTKKKTTLSDFTIHQKFTNRQDLLMLKVAKSISSFVLCDASPFFWTDAGAPKIGQINWYIYKRSFTSSGNNKNQRF